MSFPYKITLTYALFSIAWFATSDRALKLMLQGEELFVAQGYKSAFFVLFTSVMLLLFLVRETRRREANETMLANQRESISKLSQAVSQSPVGIIVTDAKGCIEYVNNAYEQLSGYDSNDLQDGTSRLCDQKKNPQAVYDQVWATINAGQQWDGELLNRRKDGSSYWVHARISPVLNEAETITHFLSIQEDITQRKSQESRIKHQANYDALTELPNRFLAMDRMSQAINNAIRHDHAMVLMFIDLDNFKRINDSFGQDIGDQLITLAAARINETVRQTDTVARYGGDEFMIILNNIDSPQDAPRVAEKVLTSLANSFFINDKELNITASIGMAVFPDDGHDPFELLRHADAAMYAAKDEGGNRYEFYSAEVNAAAVQRMAVEQRLRTALENNEFELNYQPVVDLSNGKITSAEVLLRWQNPELGQVSPSEFLPLAEATGLIIPIGEWVIRNACRQLQQWDEQGTTGLGLMINISPRQFRDVNLLSVVSDSLDEFQLDGSRLELEITEHLLGRDQEDTRLVLDMLRKKGIRIALDNFGTGASSLNHIREFPFDTLKIDHATVNKLLLRTDDKALIEGTLTMAKGLGLKTVGEGVESSAQYDYLRSQGFDKVQGFLFTRALPADDFKSYVDTFQQPPASADN